MNALDEVLELLPHLDPDSNAVAEAVQRVGAAPVALALLPRLSPSGALSEIERGNPELDRLLVAFDEDERAISALASPSLVNRLENDFAVCVPAIADAMTPLEAWAIPLLSALAGPLAPLLSVGLTLACKVALLALKAWAAKRVVAQKGT